MKARQSSIYRKLENLLGALMAVSERVPKNSMGLQTAMARCINEVVDSLVVCEYALRAIDINQRIAYIATLIHSLTIVKTIVRELHEYSRKEKSGMVNVDGEAKLVKVPLYGRIISNGQYPGFLKDFDVLARETGAWYKSQLTKRDGGVVASRRNKVNVR